MPVNPNTAPAPEGNNIVAILNQLRRGQTVADLSDALREVIAAVRSTRKKGSLTLKLTVAPHSKGDDVVLSITDDLKVTEPKAERASSIFYATDSNDLVRSDPRQTEMRFAVVGSDAPPAAVSASRKTS